MISPREEDGDGRSAAVIVVVVKVASQSREQLRSTLVPTPFGMPLIFPRPKAIKCYYCQSLVSSPSSPLFANFASSQSAGNINFDPNFFRCPYCDCWNRYDAHGEIVNDEPAMRDEKLNMSSFSKRGMYLVITSQVSPRFGYQQALQTAIIFLLCTTQIALRTKVHFAGRVQQTKPCLLLYALAIYRMMM